MYFANQPSFSIISTPHIQHCIRTWAASAPLQAPCPPSITLKLTAACLRCLPPLPAIRARQTAGPANAAPAGPGGKLPCAASSFPTAATSRASSLSLLNSPSLSLSPVPLSPLSWQLPNHTAARPEREPASPAFPTRSLPPLWADGQANDPSEIPTPHSPSPATSSPAQHHLTARRTSPGRTCPLALSHRRRILSSWPITSSRPTARLETPRRVRPTPFTPTTTTPPPCPASRALR